MTDYHDELLQIYTEVRGGCQTDEMKRSVIYATSPFNNSINEKCARIREAFVSNFDERLAEHYFVTGKRGEPKRISPVTSSSGRMEHCRLNKWITGVFYANGAKEAVKRSGCINPTDTNMIWEKL